MLLINYDFPPALSGVRRMVKFCAHLPAAGWKTSVLCARPYDPLGRDWDGLAEVERLSVPVTRTRSFDLLALRSLFRKSASPNPVNSPPSASPASSPSTGFLYRMGKSLAKLVRSVLVPDDRIGWLPFALWAGWRLCCNPQTRPTVLLSSSYPHSAHLIGYLLSRITGLPWVADFRDGWTQNPYFGPPRRGLRRWIHFRLERLVVQSADAVIAVSEPIAQHLRSVRGRSGVTIIPNGFDPADYPQPALPVQHRLIGYTGTFFGARSPEDFLRALAQVRADWTGEWPVRVAFQSALDPAHQQLIQDLGLSNCVDLIPMGSHLQSLALQQKSDLLLLVEPPGTGSEIMLTQKVFEYLGARRPILAIVPKGASRHLLSQTGGAWLVDPGDQERIAEVLRQWLYGAEPPPQNSDALASLTRSGQARQLAEVLDRVAGLAVGADQKTA